MNSQLLRLVFLLVATVLESRSARADLLYAVIQPFTGGGVELLTVDPLTGTILTAKPITNAEVLFGLCNDGFNLYSIDGFNDPLSDRTLRIDPATGMGTILGDTNFNWNFRSCDVLRTTGVLYGATDNSLYTISTTTGAATLVFNLSAPNLEQLTALAISPTGDAIITDTTDTSVFRLNLGTGMLTFLGNANLGTLFYDLSFDSTGRLWGVKQGGGLYTIDTTNGAATLVNPNFIESTGISFACDAACQPFEPIYNGCAGSAGTPILTAQGTLAPASAMQVDLTGALPNAASVLMIGSQGANLVREGCSLLFIPHTLIPVMTDALGGFSILAHWPAGVSPGLAVHLQAYVIDAGAATGFATSNTVKFTTP